jgi:hypothetical protein
MAVGESQHRHLMATGPLLGKELFPGIDGKAPIPLLGHRPAIAAGPNLLQHKHLGHFDPQQQGTPF